MKRIIAELTQERYTEDGENVAMRTGLAWSLMIAGSSLSTFSIAEERIGGSATYVRHDFSAGERTRYLLVEGDAARALYEGMAAIAVQPGPACPNLPIAAALKAGAGVECTAYPPRCTAQAKVARYQCQINLLDETRGIVKTGSGR
jgi:hypothetical protein